MAMKLEKVRHSLHECRTGSEFIERLNVAVGGADAWHPQRFVSHGVLRGVFLGGSIPLGIGSPVSDVDLIAIVDAESSLPRNLPNDRNIVHKSIRTENTSVIMLCRGIEIDINYVTAGRVEVIYERLLREGRLPPVSDMRLISRIRRGWILWSDPDLSTLVAELRSNSAVEIRCCVEAFVFALQLLDDAREALNDNLSLSLHLGRLAVEWAFKAHLATLGELYVGDKWLRLAGCAKDPFSPGQSYLFAEAERLFFPSRTEAPANTTRYLDEVACFLTAAREQVEQNPAFRVAFKLCPQIENPGV
jgi:hypothetical protein